MVNAIFVHKGNTNKMEDVKIVKMERFMIILLKDVDVIKHKINSGIIKNV